ncbi:endonuclease/exonuclease/phosphatase family protein [Parapedobacter sp. ISTM3]|uniref:endonuclease/exonuclease/phosphatase family protein n=1 Tax=Parapedobacter sp. ISTM3 TaxID=2800130 RepID=UPI001908D9CE|nr:endonuclease/exonuclease/phosphatase family protein [Parapedobacter sp. ISTM3]MBK1439121.1 endonuclease/exonuclease/phosphatase family protein [Parapedobacter sp. ISTM3]
MKKVPVLIHFAFLFLVSACGKVGSDLDEPGEPNPPQTGTVIKSGDTVRMVTYNIHHANPPSRPGEIDIEAIAAVINRVNPDVVALQEVDVRTQRSGPSLDQARTLATRTGMQVFFSKSIDYQGGEYGNAILSRYPIVQRVRHELPSVPGVSTEARSLAVIAVETENGERIYFGTTHLDVSHAETRNLQVDKLRDVNEALGAPFVLGGDFNAQVGSETINRLVAGNVFRVACLGSCPNTIPAASPSRAIDFIFLNQAASSAFTVVGYASVNETYASDHRPVVAELVYR